MKHKTNILLGTCICIMLSCTEMEVNTPSPATPDEYESITAGLPSGPASANGRTAGLSLQTVSAATLQAGTNTSVISYRSGQGTTTGSHLRYQVNYVALNNVTGLPSFGFASNIKIISPPVPLAVFPWEKVRAEYSAKLNQLNLTANFKNRLLSAYDYIRNIDTQSYQEFRNSFVGRLQSVALEQRVPGRLTALEKFMLTQAFYSVLNTTGAAYSANPGKGCNQTREEWKKVAESAFITGFTSGISLGVTWAAEGALATALAGQPLVGAVVGGAYGFVTGFVGGALAGGAGALIWNCLSNKLFGVMQHYRCGQSDQFGDYRPNPMPPIGCATGHLIDLRAFTQVPLVPNAQQIQIETGVLNDLNWLLGYL